MDSVLASQTKGPGFESGPVPVWISCHSLVWCVDYPSLHTALIGRAMYTCANFVQNFVQKQHKGKVCIHFILIPRFLSVRYVQNQTVAWENVCSSKYSYKCSSALLYVTSKKPGFARSSLSPRPSPALPSLSLTSLSQPPLSQSSLSPLSLLLLQPLMLCSLEGR